MQDIVQVERGICNPDEWAKVGAGNVLRLMKVRNTMYINLYFQKCIYSVNLLQWW